MGKGPPNCAALMILARLAELEREIARDATLSGEIASISVYYFHEAQWRAVDGTVVADAECARDLSRTLAAGKDWRHSRSRDAFYPILSHKAVLRVTYPAPPRSPTRARHAEQLRQCLDRAHHRFDATHDILTGLLNAQEFERRFVDLLPAPPTQQEPGVAAASSPSPPAALGLFALDIDHFKQVNDTYGHLYGDIVLQVVSNRLLDASKALSRENPNLRIEVARPSGEEFLVAVSAPLSVGEFTAIGERFREAIAQAPLPTEAEVARHAGGTADEALRLPPVHERRVTLSAGMSIVSLGHRTEGAASLRAARDRADRALYSAKAGGRNCLRSFDEIRQYHGAVIEHHPDTGVVTIDIGRAVGVSVGQEFLVYHRCRCLGFGRAVAP